MRALVRLLIAGGLVAAAVVVWMVATGDEAPEEVAARKAPPVLLAEGEEPTVPLNPAIPKLALKFVQTAVTRADVDASWDIVAPEYRKGYTRAEWAAGAIPVVPYNAKLGGARYQVDISTSNDAMLRIGLLPRKGDTETKAGTFIIKLHKFGERWLVTYWAPRGQSFVPGLG
jgi:hypothetical protein